MKRTTTIIRLILIVILAYQCELYAYSKNVHEQITKKTIDQNINLKKYLTDIGFSKGVDTLLNHVTIRDWVITGSWMEDVGYDIATSHYYEPISNKGYSVLGVEIGQSAYNRANDPTNSMSWIWARSHFYEALTTNFNGRREPAFADVFRALGQVMHLVQDVAVPAHTRNDFHLDGEPYEAYIGKIFKRLNYTSIPFQYWNALVSQGAPKQFWDLESYNGSVADDSGYIGLAEYTSANFFSQDTIFKDFPHPARENTNFEDFGLLPITVITTPGGINHNTFYISGYGKKYLAAMKYFAAELFNSPIPLPIKKYELTPTLDNRCHEEYAQKLIPRAVGYSAGLLDYFFRGNIEITLPDSGVYAQIQPPATGFTQIKLMAKNTSANGEQMNNGTIELVVGYRLAIDNPFLNYPETYPFQAENEMTYRVVPEKNGIRSIPYNGSVELTFDLSQNPIPLWAINVMIQLVYHGWLGSEDGAVVVGFKDISEPTPVDLFNDMDKICLNKILYTAGSPEAIDQVDTNNNGIPTLDVYPHDLSDIYLKTSSQYASDTNYNIAVPYLNAGYYVRASYILTDYTFSYNSYQTLIKKDNNDIWGHAAWASGINPGIAIKNQIEYEEDPAVCAPLSAPCNIWWYPTFLTYRGVNIWWGGGIMFINKAYPQGSECSCYQGVLRNCMSGAQTLKVADTAGKTRGNISSDTLDSQQPLRMKTRMETGIGQGEGFVSIVSNSQELTQTSKQINPEKATDLTPPDVTIAAPIKDNIGNTDTVPYSAPITLDTTAPILTVSTLSDGSWTNNELLNVSGQVTDNNGIQQLNINDVDVAINPDGSFSYPVVLQDGPNTVGIRVTDLAGNEVSDMRMINLDQDAPVITIATPADNMNTKQSWIDVTGAVDDQSTVTVKVNAANPMAALMNGNNFSLTVALVYGINTIEVTATDLAGNTSRVKRTVTFDDQNPSLSVTYPAQDIKTNQSTITIRGEVTDLTVVTITVTMDGNIYTPAVTSGRFEQTVTFTEGKTYQIYVKAVDEAGNETLVQRNVVYDTTAPSVTLDPVTSPTNLNWK